MCACFCCRPELFISSVIIQISGPMIRRWCDQNELFYPLVLLVKIFLHQRRVDKSTSGGIGGYATVLMVRHFLKSNQLVDLEHALKQFFVYYRVFKTRHYQIDEEGNMIEAEGGRDLLNVRDPLHGYLLLLLDFIDA